MAEINEPKIKVKKTDDIIGYRKAYYQANKNRILENMSQKILCEYCSCDTSKQAINKHNNSTKHKRNVELFELKKRLNDKII